MRHVNGTVLALITTSCHRFGSGTASCYRRTSLPAPNANSSSPLYWGPNSPGVFADNPSAEETSVVTGATQ